MPKLQENNYAFIDSQNLHLSIQSLGWKFDFKRFRTYLLEKYGVTRAYMFIGFVAGNSDLYKEMQDAGYICIFKPTLVYKDGTTKGNCDAELVLQAMIDLPTYDGAIIVTGDGDFHCLAKHLLEQGKLKTLMIPNQRKYSALLKLEIFHPYLRFVSDLRSKLAYKVARKKKSPHKDDNL